jgi:Stress responsive A/B Barrel Domain
VISHIVLFNPKKDVSQAARKSFALQIRDVCRTIGSVRAARIGRAIAVNPGYGRSFGDKTYEFAAILDFDRQDDLITYLQHPLHDELGRLFWLYCESTVVVEVETRDAKSDAIVDLLAE